MECHAQVEHHARAVQCGTAGSFAGAAAGITESYAGGRASHVGASAGSVPYRLPNWGTSSSVLLASSSSINFLQIN